MANLRIFALQGKRLHRSAGAVAGFASALSVLIGTLAGYATPRGFGRVTMALHLTHKPFLLRLAPVITGVAVALATAAGLLGFYLWITERPEEAPVEPEDPL
jgi:ABC-type spermidine/putrescine transport system permease subunit II